MFITTAIDYTNAPPHIGHAYEKVLADAIARYRRLKGESVYFLTGVDQHGQKVQQAAEREGVPPIEFAERISAKFLALWKKLGVEPDGWASTTDPRHARVVKKILQALHDKGDLYKAKYAGFYSVRQEQFLTEKERQPDGTFGAEWGQVIEIEEENWYFKLSSYRDWLLGFVRSHPELVLPGFRLAELVNALEGVSGDLCISRPKTRLAWGIDLPFDPLYVTYVWFDALINYISFAGYLSEPEAGLPDFAATWQPGALLHVIGKDILSPPHGIYWPIMLHAIGFSDAQMPQLLVHGWWNLGGAKMSKSAGNVVDPSALADKYGEGALRYYLLRDIATGHDADFSEDRLRQRYNADLANDLGNLLNRTLNMIQRYRGGVLTRPAEEGALSFLAGRTLETYRQKFDEFQPQAALEAVWTFISDCNSFIEKSAPWKLAKDPAQASALDAVLYDLAESLRIIAILVSPVLPKAALVMCGQLRVILPGSLAAAAWGALPGAHQVGSPEPLFPRMEIESD